MDIIQLALLIINPRTHTFNSLRHTTGLTCKEDNSISNFDINLTVQCLRWWIILRSIMKTVAGFYGQ